MKQNYPRSSVYNYYSPKSDRRKKLILLFGGIFIILTLYWLSTSAHKTIQLLPIDYQRGRCPAVSGIEQISWAPRIYIYRDFLSNNELLYLQQLTSNYEKNGFPKTKTDLSRLLRKDVKTKGIFPTTEGMAQLTHIEYKLSMWSLLPIENGENFQFSKITPSDPLIPPHFDYFLNHSPADLRDDGGQRVLTIILILSDAEEGGDLSFPDANIKMQVKKGDAILYYNKMMNGEVDRSTAHSFLPVTSGELRLLTKYYRENLHPHNFYYSLIHFE